MTTDIDVAGPAAGTLALRSDQHQWSEQQNAALTQIGLADAPEGDLAVFLHVAQRTGLDPFSRQIYMIKRWDSQAGRDRYTIQTGIDGFRIIADRRPEYGGQVGPQWCGDDGQWRDFWTGTTPPAAARVGVIRRDWDTPIFGVAMFAEYAQTKKGGDLTSMWREKGALMIAKCAEALALRKAFPQDLAGVVSPEEADRDVAPTAGRQRATATQQAPVTVRELTGAVEVPVGVDLADHMTPPQQSKLFALLREAEIDVREERFTYASKVLGRPIESYGQLSVSDASVLIDNLDAIVAGEPQVETGATT